MIFNMSYSGSTDAPVSLAVTNPPDQTEYTKGDTLDLTGIKVVANYDDGTTREVTGQATYSPADGSVLSTGGTITITATWNSLTATTTITVIVPHIYGAYWDGSANPAWTRTDEAADFTDPVPYVNGASSYSSPFDNLMPWSGMQIVEDPEAGTLVSIPKFWYKWTRSGDSMKLQIADAPIGGFLVSPAHADRGDGNGERDVVYVGRYHCASDYKSKTGVTPRGSMTRATARSGISALGSTIWQWDYAMLWTIRMLYLVEYAHWNSQEKIGYGCGNGSSVQNTGAADSMLYHTGTTKSSRSSYGVGCQYRYIEGLWDNVFDWCDGIYFSGSTVYGIKNPASFSDSSGGTSIGTKTTSSGCTTKWTAPSQSGFEYALYPSAVSGENYSIYACDRSLNGSSGAVLFVGGGFYYTLQDFGLFYANSNDGVSASYSSTGSRLMKLP